MITMEKEKFKQVYIKIAIAVSDLSYANRRKVGSVLVKDGNIISFGYNGTPTGFDNICEINDITVKEVLHAESNVIAKVAKTTLSSENSALYTTCSPCFECSKLIIQAGIKEVYYTEEYHDLSGLELLRKANVHVEKLSSITRRKEKISE